MKQFKIKKILSLLLICTIVAGSFMSFSTDASAATEYTQGDYTYTVNSGYAKIVSFPENHSGEITIPSKLGGYTVNEIGAYAFYACTTLTKVVIPNTVTTIGNYAFAYCIELKHIEIPSSVKTIGNNVFRSSNNVVIYCPKGSQAYKYANSNGISYTIIPDKTVDIYNLGEETYSFENFGDEDSAGGHCFGMSMTSSGYHIGKIDQSIIGLSSDNDIYSCTLSSVVKEPICHYQNLQGSYALVSTVAGGSYYKTSIYDINNDWEEVTKYVKDHSYDDKGLLQIGFRKNNEGGHAINFLRYAVVDGEERIYAYDNNFPFTETYFYKNKSGEVMQIPEATFSGSIDCIALRNVETFFEHAGDYDGDKFIFADRDTIKIDGITPYPLDGGIVMKEEVVFVIPKRSREVKIIPLIDNASFTYNNETYNFSSINENTYGVLSLTDSSEKAEFIISDKSDSSCSCNCHKTGITHFFFIIVNFFQKLFGQNKVCACGVAH